MAAAVTAIHPAAVVHQLLDGWREADATKAAATWAPEFRLLTLRRDGQGRHIEQDTRESLLKSMATIKPGLWDVRLGRLIANIDASGIASLSAPYTFYMNGRKTHCGVENFTLYRLNDGWKIVQFADTHLGDGSDAKCLDRAEAR